MLSSIWPDEPDRLNRANAALERAAEVPSHVAAESAGDWLPHALASTDEGELTIVWHSLFRQYVAADEWNTLQDAFGDAVEASRRRTIVWLSMEPSDDHLERMELTIRLHPDQPAQHLASCGDHGPPVNWGSGGSLS